MKYLKLIGVGLLGGFAGYLMVHGWLFFGIALLIFAFILGLRAARGIRSK